jgi:hypothetical protein
MPKLIALAENSVLAMNEKHAPTCPFTRNVKPTPKQTGLSLIQSSWQHLFTRLLSMTRQKPSSTP